MSIGHDLFPRLDKKRGQVLNLFVSIMGHENPCHGLRYVYVSNWGAILAWIQITIIIHRKKRCSMINMLYYAHFYTQKGIDCIPSVKKDDRGILQLIILIQQMTKYTHLPSCIDMPMYV